MAAAKTTTGALGSTTYHITDANNNHLTVQPASTNPLNITIMSSDGNKVVLTRQNVTDILPALTVFSTTGVVV
jgi:hypothetical protein